MIRKLASPDALLPSVDLIEDQAAVTDAEHDSRFSHAKIDDEKVAERGPIAQPAPALADYTTTAPPQDPKPSDPSRNPLSVLKTMTEEEIIALFT